MEPSSELETLAGSREEKRSLAPIDEFDDADDLDSFAVEVIGAMPLESLPRLVAGAMVDSTYRIVSVLGAGAMGVVYEAIDLRLDRRVALKLHDQAPRPDRTSRMWREAKAMARLSDPNVVAVHEVGWHHGRVYIAMELVEGSTARAWQQERRRPWREIVDVYVQAARGLHAAHRVGIVHRDFKPDNVLVGRDAHGEVTRVRVADFGLARLAGAIESSEQLELAKLRGGATATGAAVGTPAYMAPEQIAGALLDASADQFSFCVALYEALWQRRPFARPTLAEALGATVMDAPAEPPADGGVPRRLFEIVRRGLAKLPAERWPDMGTLARVLVDDPSRRRRWIALGLGTASVVAFAAWTAGSASQASPSCTTEDARIDATWNQARATELVASFSATTRADGVAYEVIARLDRWVEQWRIERHEACVATRIDGVQSEARMDERIDCLERLRVQVGATIDVLGRGDALVISRAETIADALPPVAACADPTTLAALDIVAPIQREQYDVLVAEIATARAESFAGRHVAAHERLDAAVSRCDEAGFSRLCATGRVARAHALRELESRDAAVADALAAIQSALAGNDPAVAGTAMLELTLARGRTPGGTDEALRWLDAAGGLAQAEHTPALDPLRLDVVRTTVLALGERFDEAEAVARAALARSEASTPERANDRAQLLLSLAQALEAQHRSDEALATFADARATAERMHGRDHPRVATVLQDTGDLLGNQGRFEEALVAKREALAVFRRFYGERSIEAASARIAVAQTLVDLGKVDEARPDLEAAAALAHELGDDYHELAAVQALAQLDRVSGDNAGSERRLLGAIALAQRVFGEDGTGVADIEINAAMAISNSGRFEESYVLARRAMARYERRLAATDPAMMAPAANLAMIAALSGRADEAVRLLERVERLVALAPLADAQHTGGLHSLRGHVLSKVGRHGDAASAFGQSADAFEQLYGAQHPAVLRQLVSVGDELLADERTDDAIAQFERVLRDGPGVGMAAWELAAIHFRLARTLWPDRSKRPRVRAHVESARAGFAAPAVANDLAELEIWVAAHP